MAVSVSGFAGFVWTKGRTVQDLCGFAMKSASYERGLSAMEADRLMLIWANHKLVGTVGDNI